MFNYILFFIPDSLSVKYTVHANTPGIHKCS